MTPPSQSANARKPGGGSIASTSPASGQPTSTDLKPIDYAGGPPPAFAAVPRHVAIVMDGNGRWANQQGLHRTEGHKAGEWALMDVVAGAIQAGVTRLSVYAFSTENWSRSPAEIRFLMTYINDVLARQEAQLNAWGVRIVHAGRPQRLWKNVQRAFDYAERATAHNTRLVLTMCYNYGARAEIVDAVREIAAEAAAGRLRPDRISEASFARHLSVPDDVDLFIRCSGEQRLSNYLLWQSAYAELVYQHVLWPDYRRGDLWEAIHEYGARNRRFGGAVDAPKA